MASSLELPSQSAGLSSRRTLRKAEAITTYCYHPASSTCTGWATINKNVGYGPNGVGAYMSNISSHFAWNQNLPSQRNCVQTWSITAGGPLGGWFCGVDWRWEAYFQPFPVPPGTTYVGSRCTQTTLAWTNGKCGIRYYP